MTPRVGILAPMGGHGVYNVKKSWSSFTLLLNLNGQWIPTHLEEIIREWLSAYTGGKLTIDWCVNN